MFFLKPTQTQSVYANGVQTWTRTSCLHSSLHLDKRELEEKNAGLALFGMMSRLFGISGTADATLSFSGESC